MVSIPRLSAPFSHLLGKKNLNYETAVFTVKMADRYRNHRCHMEKNVPKALILPSRWQDGAESLGIKTTSSL